MSTAINWQVARARAEQARRIKRPVRFRRRRRK